MESVAHDRTRNQIQGCKEPLNLSAVPKDTRNSRAPEAEMVGDEAEAVGVGHNRFKSPEQLARLIPDRVCAEDGGNPLIGRERARVGACSPEPRRIPFRQSSHRIRVLGI
jgi:hypothetical protein